VLTRLQDSVLRKRPKLWPDKWILHHDNAPMHDAKNSWLRHGGNMGTKRMGNVCHWKLLPEGWWRQGWLEKTWVCAVVNCRLCRSINCCYRYLQLRVVWVK
jgi:hypothetical protein